jgi:hypothetical protein
MTSIADASGSALYIGIKKSILWTLGTKQSLNEKINLSNFLRTKDSLCDIFLFILILVNNCHQ